MDILKIARTITEVLEEKKGEEIVLLDLQGIASFADYFVICSGTSDRMIQSLMDSVVEKIREKYRLRPTLEGEPPDGWLLADYGDIILHLFSLDQRDFYNLEELWSEGKVLLHVQ